MGGSLWETNFKLATKTYKAEQKKKAEKEKIEKIKAKQAERDKELSSNPYDDGSIWSKAPTRNWIKDSKSQEELYREQQYGLITSNGKKNAEYVIQKFKDNNQNEHKLDVSQEYVDNYYKTHKLKDPLAYPRSSVENYTQKLNLLGIEIPLPDILDKALTPLEMLGKISTFVESPKNFALGMIDEVIKIKDERNIALAEGTAKETELEKQKRLKGDFMNSLSEKPKKVNGKYELLYDDLNKPVKLQSEDFISWDNLTRVIKAGGENFKNSITALFSTENFKDVKSISNVFDTMRNTTDTPWDTGNDLTKFTLDPIKGDKWYQKADNFLVDMAGEVATGKFDIEGIGDGLAVLRRAKEMNVIDDIADATKASNLDEAKIAISSLYRAKATDTVKTNLAKAKINLAEDSDEFQLLVQDTLDRIAKSKTESLVERSRKVLGGTNKDYKGITMGGKVILSREALEKLGQNKITRGIGTVAGAYANPFSIVKETYKATKKGGLLGEGTLKGAGDWLHGKFSGGKTQDIYKDIYRTFNSYNDGKVELTNLYKNIQHKFAQDELRHGLELQKTLDKSFVESIAKRVEDIDKAEKEALENGIETQGRKFTQGIEEVAIDGVGGDGVIVNKENLEYLQKARDLLKGEQKGLYSDLFKKKFKLKSATNNIDEDVIKEYKGQIASKLDGVVKNNNTNIKKLTTRISKLTDPDRIAKLQSKIDDITNTNSLLKKFQDGTLTKEEYEAFSKLDIKFKTKEADDLKVWKEKKTSEIEMQIRNIEDKKSLTAQRQRDIEARYQQKFSDRYDAYINLKLSMEKNLKKMKKSFEEKGFTPETNPKRYAQIQKLEQTMNKLEVPFYGSGQKYSLSGYDKQIEVLKKRAESIKNSTGKSMFADQSLSEKLNQISRMNKAKTVMTAKGQDITGISTKIATKDKFIRNMIDNASDLKTLTDYNTSINNIVASYKFDVNSAMKDVEKATETINVNKRMIGDIAEMSEYYASVTGEKVPDNLFDLTKVTTKFYEGSIDNFANASDSVKSVANDIIDAFKTMGVSEDIVGLEEASEYYSYLLHALRPELKGTKAEELLEGIQKFGVETSDEIFNIHALSRKLQGTIQDINKQMKNEYDIDNFFETNIIRLLALRVDANGKFMYKKQLRNFLQPFSKTFDYKKLDDIDINSLDEIFSDLGIQYKKPDIESKIGLGQEKRFTDPPVTEIIDGKPVTTGIKKDSEIYTQYKSYTGIRTDAVNRYIGGEFSVDSIMGNLKEKLKTRTYDIDINSYRGQIRDLKQKLADPDIGAGQVEEIEKTISSFETEVKKILTDKSKSEAQHLAEMKFVSSLRGRMSLTKEQAERLADINGELSDTEWLPFSERANVVYSPEEIRQQKLKQLRDWVFNVKNGKNPDYIYLEKESGTVKETKVIREVDPKAIAQEKEIPVELEVATKDIERGMVDDKMAEGLSVEEAEDYVNSADARYIIDQELKNINEEWFDPKVATQKKEINFLDETRPREVEETVEDLHKIVQRGAYEQFERMAGVNQKHMDNIALDLLKKANTYFKAYAVTSTGFHINNIAGGIMNNFIAIGADALNPKTAFEAQKFINELNKIWKNGGNVGDLTGEIYGMAKSEVAQQIVDSGLLSTFMSIEKNNYDDLLEGTADALKKDSKIKKVLGAINPLDLRRNILIQASNGFGNKSEQLLKITNFMANLKNGRNLAESADLAVSAMFDYTDTTVFDEKVLKYLMPFVTFVERNVPFYVDALSESMYRTRLVTRGITHWNDTMTPEKEKTLKPAYLGDAIRIGENKYISLDLPMASFIKTTVDPASLLSGLHPAIKGGFEMYNNKYTWNDAEISATNNAAEKLAKVTVSNTPMILMQQRLLSLIPGIQENGLVEKLRGDVTTDTTLAWLKGGKVKTFDTEKREIATMYEYAEQLKDLFNKYNKKK